ncbi:MAG: UDP-N-acetylmuramoyl-L-alanyl-D-glutamate--2,6-diaminopimelate ligase [Alphaproteobacteria bacterium]|nr:UDP-N-acetylmuramoyl-L-alanyl-D-glutamate--2,6-diaminopimelate ligase [Alphaproteobacteria bacterium]
MNLKNLFQNVKIILPQEDLEISGITTDSRKVEPGYLFIATPGVKINGTDFIEQAYEKGAIACLIPEDYIPKTNKMIFLKSSNIRKDTALLAANFYNKQPEKIVAVTGTNGKTSTVNYCRQIWENLKKDAASIGTLGIITKDFSQYGSMTTPDSITLHQEINTLTDNGIKNLAFEASSHGIEQNRIDGIRITAAGFTNITRDHLDYHKTMENYLNAKLGLFNRELSSNTVVLNSDIPEFSQIKNYCLSKKLKIIDYGFQASSIKILSSIPESSGQKVKLEIFDQTYLIKFPLVGHFQLMNALCSLGLCIATMESDEKISDYVKQLEVLKGIPGRMELVGSRNNANIYVDYAHTPDALENVLKALRPHTTKKLHVVFGCGGDRDRGKRPQMGAICQKLADVIYVTDDNPRSEEPFEIRASILPSCPDAFNIGDRALAIKTAIKNLEDGDTLVIAGKGHEIGQMIKGINHPFDDRVEARKAIIEVEKPLWQSSVIAEATSGRAGSNFDIYGISIDTRTIKKGELYIALIGEKVNGHAFIQQAFEKGACGALVSTIPEGIDTKKLIVVQDTLQALKDLAKEARKRTKAKIIGITGSSGKTSTKEMLRSALSCVGLTHYTLGNLNNNIGVPLTLSRMPQNCDFAILEMGINHFGEMTELTDLVRPDFVLITMIGNAHCEYFKQPEETALAKAEIFTSMNKNGAVLLNADNELFSTLEKEAKKNNIKNIYAFGSNAENYVSLLHLSHLQNKNEITIRINNSTYSYQLNIPGKHQVLNSLGVVGILSLLNVDMQTCLQGLSLLKPSEGRGKALILRCPQKKENTYTLIDDAYNANPESVKAGLNVLGEMSTNGKKIAVLADMLELGEKSIALHLSIKNYLLSNKVDYLFAVGEAMGKLFDDIKLPGAKTKTSLEMVKNLSKIIGKDDIVYVKGSNSMKLSALIKELKELSNAL